MNSGHELCIESTRNCSRFFAPRGDVLMSKKFLLFVCFTVALAFVTSISVFSQTAPVRGQVKLQQADGTHVPVADALVEPYRIDIDQGKLPSAKTNKNGEFTFIGFSPANQYVLAVSGASLTPTISNTVRGGMESVAILVYPGDGRQLTETEVRALAKQGTKAGSASEADRKKAQEEYDKQLAKYNEEKSKTENITKIVNAALKDGDAAYKAKDYGTAIAKFDEGINADPNFEGSAPVLLNYKGVALKSRAFEAYQRSTKADADAKAAELMKAKADFLASIEAYDRGLKIITNAKPEDASAQASADKNKLNLLTNSVETYRLTVKTNADVAKAKDAPPVFEQYFALENDSAKKLSARLILADILREAGESEPAIVAYRTVLESEPNNADALAGIGLSLFNVGVVEDDKVKMQEGLNYMQKFADTAPDTHPLKVSVREAVDYLKTEQKLAPQKVAPTKKRP